MPYILALYLSDVHSLLLYYIVVIACMHHLLVKPPIKLADLPIMQFHWLQKQVHHIWGQINRQSLKACGKLQWRWGVLEIQVRHKHNA